MRQNKLKCCKSNQNKSSHNKKSEIIRFEVSKKCLYLGDVLTIDWETSGADIVELQPFGKVNPTDSKKIKITSNEDRKMEFALSVKNGQSTAIEYITIEIRKTEALRPVINSFESDRYSVSEDDIVLLSWNTLNADQLSIGKLNFQSSQGSLKYQVKFGVNDQVVVRMIVSNKQGSVESTVTFYRIILQENNTEKNTNEVSKPLSNNIHTYILWMILLFSMIFIGVVYYHNKEKDSSNQSGNRQKNIDIDDVYNSQLEIVSISTDTDATAISFKYNSGRSSWVNINSKAYLLANDKKFFLSNAVDIPMAPETLKFTESDSIIYFRLIFSSIGNAQTFDMCECPDQGCFNIKGVKAADFNQ